MTKPIVIGSNSYNGHARWRDLLDSIKARRPGIDQTRMRLVLCDDGSPKSPEMHQVAMDYGVDIFVRHDQNRGISASWNAIAKAAWELGAEIAVILNDDILVHDDWLASMVYFLEENPSEGAASWPFVWFQKHDAPGIIADPRTGMVRTHQGEPSEQLRNPPWLWIRPGRAGAFAGCCFAITRAAWEAVGGFNEEMKSFFEETLFGYQMMQHGFQARCLTGPLLWHAWSQTFRESPELHAGERGVQSREIFWRVMNVPPEHRDKTRPFTWVEDTIFKPAPDRRVKWWTPMGVQEG